ncbi:MAG: insulinase family protein [Gemmatimonadota bacterium]|nr:insulinase family protein [Gemmatimonadota bacterium]
MTTAVRPLPGPPREYHFPRFERSVLANGMNVIVAPARKLPVISVAMVVDATAIDDPAGLEGLADLTAQALREGTTSRDGMKLALDLEKLGTSVEAGAGWDNTVASMTVLTDRLKAAFDLFAEVLLAPKFDEADITRLKAERLAERMQIMSEPRGLAEESFSRFVYTAESRYAEPMSGTTDSISRISRQAVVDFYVRNYVPGRATLLIVGDISVDEGVRLAEAAFGTWKGDRVANVRVADKPARKTRSVEIIAKPDAAQSELRIGHVGLSRSHPDYFDIVVMNSVLGGLFSSRINLNLREAHGYTYGASSYYDWRRQAGPFVISTAVQSEVTSEAIQETLKEITRMQGEEISQDELTLATSYLAGVFPIRYETTASIASALANLVTYDLPETYYDTYRAMIAGVTTTSVLSAVRNHVKTDELQVVVVGNPEIIQAPVEALGLGQLEIREVTDA